MMVSYSIVPNDQGFHVEVVGANGARNTMLGFGTEDEAIQWIDADKQRERFRQPD